LTGMRHEHYNIADEAAGFPYPFAGFEFFTLEEVMLTRSVSKSLTSLAIGVLVVSAGLSNSALVALNAPNEPATQYATIAPLPGAGTALNSLGKPDGIGAIQTNIPVAYTPGQDYLSLGAFNGNHIREFDDSLSNGSGVVALGLGKWPRFYASAMLVSGIVFTESKAVSMQLQVVNEQARVPAFAFGVQDALNKEHEEFNARAYYGVATKSLLVAGRKVFATLGYGSGRFLNKPFGGISAPLNNLLNLAVEYDGFQMNEALAYRPGGRYGNVTLLGAYNNKAGPLAGVTFTGKAPTSLWLALPVLFLLQGR